MLETSKNVFFLPLEIQGIEELGLLLGIDGAMLT